jgi:hypothetical protein
MDFSKIHSSLKDEMGRYRTQSLFWELRYGSSDKYKPIFTLKDRDLKKGKETFLSLKQIYMKYTHIPEMEYEFAMDVFGSWNHWERLSKETVPAIKDEIQSWRDELDIRNRADALKKMMIASGDNDAKGVNAAKYLAEKGYLSKRGRPSKEEVERERKVQAGVSKELEGDMERLGLKVVN